MVFTRAKFGSKLPRSRSEDNVYNYKAGSASGGREEELTRKSLKGLLESLLERVEG